MKAIKYTNISCSVTKKSRVGCRPYLRGPLLMIGEIIRTSIPNGRALVAVWVAIYLLAVPTAMRDAYAAGLPGEQIEAMLEILSKTSFDSVNLDKKYGRLVLWERNHPIKIRVIVNDAFMADREIPERIEQVIVRVHQALGPNARISIAGTEDTFDADILIVSTDQREFFSDDRFRQYMLENIGLPDKMFKLTLEKIEEIQHGEEPGWSWVKFSNNKAGERTIDGFIGIIHPDKNIFETIFPRMIAASLGYGNGSAIKQEVKIQGEKRMLSVHSKFGLVEFESADEVLLHFLYNAEIKTGAREKNIKEVFQEWITSDYFRDRFDVK